MEKHFDTLMMAERFKIEKSLILLKNKDEIIPLRRLDTLDILSIYSGNESDKFHSRVNSYKESNNYSGQEFGSIQNLSSNLIIVFIDSSTNNTESVLTFLDSKRSNAKIIFVIQMKNNFDFLDQFLEIASGVLIVPYNTTHNTAVKDLSVQGIFGAIEISGSTQPGSILDLGIETKSIKRLKYTIPEEVGISSFQLDQGISKIVQEGIDSMAFPGCQILVAKEGRVFFQKSYGSHDYDLQREVCNTDIYDLASITKVTGATTALMSLYDQGKIKLDDEFTTYWPLFKNTNKEHLIFRDILAHNARLKSWIPYYLESRKKNGKYRARTVKEDSSRRFPQRLSSQYFLHKDYKEKKIYKWINETPLNEEPGYVYSGLSFYLYPEIVLNLSGESYDDFLYDHFFKPLGASTLSFNPARKFELERIVPTETDDYFRMEQIHGEVHDEGAIMMDGISGNAGLFSNANDLAKIWQMYLNGGYYGGSQFISTETLKEFTRCQFCETGNRRGLGFDKPSIVYDSLSSSVARAVSPESFGHSGYTGSFVWVDPQNQLLYIFLSNRVYPTRENRKIYTMNIRPRIHVLLYELLKGS
ncbi:MAG: serine hydrolase [Cyclobacteriaceae bacterium]|nr:serine hydrolase [Cyclobacteriaceae bacterium]